MGANFLTRVLQAQAELKAPKSQYNNFGKYNYRSCEDILEAAKPVCRKYGIMLNLSDKINQIGDRYYVEATATLFDCESDQKICSTASAREAEAKKGMDDSQVTGTASSYARKYALNGLLNIDDTKDADTDEYTKTTSPSIPAENQKVYVCADCGKAFKPYNDKNGKTWTAAQLYHMSEKKNVDGKARCLDCRKKMEESQNG